jgi:hypothetical protein
MMILNLRWCGYIKPLCQYGNVSLFKEGILQRTDLNHGEEYYALGTGNPDLLTFLIEKKILTPASHTFYWVNSVRYHGDMLRLTPNRLGLIFQLMASQMIIRGDEDKHESKDENITDQDLISFFKKPLTLYMMKTYLDPQYKDLQEKFGGSLLALAKQPTLKPLLDALVELWKKDPENGVKNQIASLKANFPLESFYWQLKRALDKMDLPIDSFVKRRSLESVVKKLSLEHPSPGNLAVAAMLLSSISFRWMLFGKENLEVMRNLAKTGNVALLKFLQAEKLIDITAYMPSPFESAEHPHFLRYLIDLRKRQVVMNNEQQLELYFDTKKLFHQCFIAAMNFNSLVNLGMLTDPEMGDYQIRVINRPLERETREDPESLEFNLAMLRCRSEITPQCLKLLESICVLQQCNLEEKKSSQSVACQG